MTDVFISYKTEDRPRVKPLVDALTAAGLSVWWDVHIEGGAAWRETIASRLDTAKAVVVIWSELSVGPAGHFVQDEAARANRRGTYLPVAIDRVEPPLGFGQHQVLPLVGWNSNRGDPHFADVLGAVEAMVAGGQRPSPKAKIAALKRPRWRLPAMAVGTAALLGGLATLGLSPPLSCAAIGWRCLAAAPANSIAVLPFANLSGDPAKEYFSDGLSEELLSTLARIGQLRVAGRTSSFKFKGSKDDATAIAARLSVASILDGSVRQSGALVRVDAQLVDAAGFERWSQTYDRELKDIFAVQSGIAEAVATALKITLLGGDIAALSRGGTRNPVAWDAFLRGRRLFDATGSEADYRAALAKLDEAIAADPAFAAAHAARARTVLALANQFAPPAEVAAIQAQALAAARRATTLAPDLAEAQSTLGSALATTQLDIVGARAAYSAAMRTGGGDANVLPGYGLFNARAGDIRAGLAALEKAAVLDPLNPRVHKSRALALLAAGRPAESIAAMRRALELNPAMAGAHATIGEALLLQGNRARAAEEYEREPTEWERLTGEAILLAQRGETIASQRAFARLASDGEATAYQQARVLAQWGEADKAMRALDIAIAAHDPGALWMARDGLLQPLRGRSDFRARLERLGFPV